MKKLILLVVVIIFSISLAYASLGATLRVPGIDTNLNLTISNKNPLVEGLVVFSANYFDVNGTEITDGDVYLEIDNKTFRMNYNPNENAYTFQRNFPFVGTYFFTITAEKQGYENATISDSISVSEKPLDKTPSSSRITSDWININIDKIQERHQSIASNQNINISISTNKSNVDRIIITSSRTITKGTIDINFLGCDEIEKFERKMYFECFSINTQDISNEQIAKTELHFRVSKNWIEGNNINESRIFVLKIDEESERLNTLEIKEDKMHRYYITEFYEFSDFVIYGESNIEDEETKKYEEIEIIHEEKERESNIESLYMILILAIILSIFYFIYTKFYSNKKF